MEIGGFILGALGLIGLVIGLVVFVVLISFFSLWLQARLSGAPVSFLELLAMKLRRVPIGMIVTNRITVTANDLIQARDELSTATGTEIATISLGTPHYSITEIGRLVEALAGRTVHRSIHMYVSTGRDVLNEAGLRGWT